MIRLKAKQQEAYKMFMKTKRIFLRWDTGIGKTFFAMYCFKKIWMKDNNATGMVICPPGAFTAVKDALNVLGISDRYYEILSTAKLRERYFDNKIKQRLIIMSYDTFKQEKNLYCKQGWKKNGAMAEGQMAKIDPTFVFFDESHKMKNHKSITGKAGAFASRLSPEYMILGTATPISKDERDLFNQMFCLDGGKRLGLSYQMFEVEYFTDRNFFRRNKEGYFPDIVLNKTKLVAFQRAISDIYHIAEKTKEIGKSLPKRSKHVLFVNKTPEQDVLYKQLTETASVKFQEYKKEFQKTNLKKNQFHASTLSLISAFRQVCCGFLYEKDPENLKAKRKVMRVSNAKLDKLRECVKAIPKNEKIIIWSVFKESFNIIEEMLDDISVGFVTVTGSTSSKKRMENLDEFRNNEHVRVFLSHPKSGGVGLNLQNAKYSIIFSRDYSFIDKVQSEGRNYRLGSLKFHKEVVEIDLRVKGTVETDIADNFKKKNELVDSFENHLNTILENNT